MDAVQDFEDFLELLGRRDVRYLIIGGLAFIYHAKPRFTKDIDIRLDPEPDNLARANAALADFGSVAPNAGGELLEEGPDQHRDVLRPLAQGRQADGEDVDAVVEVSPRRRRLRKSTS